MTLSLKSSQDALWLIMNIVNLFVIAFWLPIRLVTLLKRAAVSSPAGGYVRVKRSVKSPPADLFSKTLAAQRTPRKDQRPWEAMGNARHVRSEAKRLVRVVVSTMVKNKLCFNNRSTLRPFSKGF